MKLLRAGIIAAILLCICQFPDIMVKADNDVNIRDSIATFIQCIRRHDLVAFRKLISPSGLVVIRNFVTGGFGTRGKDIRDYYKPTQAEFEFKVSGESPVSVEWLFAGSIESTTKEIPIKRIKGLAFAFKDNGLIVKPSTMEIIETCAKIQEYDQNSEMKPRIFILSEREFALTESEYVADLSVGGWAVFEQISERYYLRAIMDFR